MAMKDVSDFEVVLAYSQIKIHDDKSFDEKTPIAERFALGILVKNTGQCEKVCFRCLERAYNRKLVDYGVSLRSGWLTDKGEKLLAEGKKAMEKKLSDET